MSAAPAEIRPVMVMAGGTGGHVYPALAVADALRAAGVPVVWLGTRTGLEARVVPAADFPIEWLSISGLRGRGLLTWLWAPVRLLRALAQAFRILSSRRPAVLLGMGGFVAGPGGVAAWLLDLPLVIHEQNARAGLTNRIQSWWASVTLEGFPASHPWPRGARHVGNPVRTTIADLPSPAERFDGRTGPFRLLVLGGSQGARSLNRMLPAALAELAAGTAVRVRHQSGAGDLEATREAYDDAGLSDDVRVEVVPFIEDMAEAYAWPDLVVCRAGALTVSELAAAGVGALMVPFPHAVDDHQTANAEWLASAGGGEVLAEDALDPRSLVSALMPLVTDRERCLSMALAAHRLARPDAAEQVARVCMALHPEVGA